MILVSFGHQEVFVEFTTRLEIDLCSYDRCVPFGALGGRTFVFCCNVEVRELHSLGSFLYHFFLPLVGSIFVEFSLEGVQACVTATAKLRRLKHWLSAHSTCASSRTLAARSGLIWLTPRVCIFKSWLRCDRFIESNSTFSRAAASRRSISHIAIKIDFFVIAEADGLIFLFYWLRLIVFAKIPSPAELNPFIGWHELPSLFLCVAHLPSHCLSNAWSFCSFFLLDVNLSQFIDLAFCSHSFFLKCL